MKSLEGVLGMIRCMYACAPMEERGYRKRVDAWESDAQGVGLACRRLMCL